MSNNQFKKTRGQSLFEVIFAIAISALVLTAVVALSSRSIRTSDNAKNNAQATKYALEATEWIRQQRDASWSNVSNNTGTKTLGGGTIGWNSGNPITGTIFSRSAVLTMDVSDSNIIDVVVRVTWNDSVGSHEVTNASKLTNWNI